MQQPYRDYGPQISGLYFRCRHCGYQDSVLESIYDDKAHAFYCPKCMCRIRKFLDEGFWDAE